MKVACDSTFPSLSRSWKRLKIHIDGFIVQILDRVLQCRDPRVCDENNKLYTVFPSQNLVAVLCATVHFHCVCRSLHITCKCVILCKHCTVIHQISNRLSSTLPACRASKNTYVVLHSQNLINNQLHRPSRFYCIIRALSMTSYCAKFETSCAVVRSCYTGNRWRTTAMALPY